MVCRVILNIQYRIWNFYLLPSHFYIVFFLFLESLGDCSFLNTCFHMDTCKVLIHLSTDCLRDHSYFIVFFLFSINYIDIQYVHYEVDHSTVPVNPEKTMKEEDKENVVNLPETKPVGTLYPPQVRFDSLSCNLSESHGIFTRCRRILYF